MAKLTAKEKARRKARQKQKRYTRKVGGKTVFGKKIASRMVRISVKYADKLARQAKRKGLSLPEYTLRLAKR